MSRFFQEMFPIARHRRTAGRMFGDGRAAMTALLFHFVRPAITRLVTVNVSIN